MIPASSRQPYSPDPNDQIAKPRPMEAPRATGTQIGNACRELSSSRTRGRGNLRSWAGARTERWSLRLTVRWVPGGPHPRLGLGSQYATASRLYQGGPPGAVV